MEHIDVAIAIVVKDGLVLVCQRMPDAPLGGYWEFPGGKHEPGESLAECATRELLEEVGIAAIAVAELPEIDYDYEGRSIRLHPFICRYMGGQAECLGCQQAIWVRPEALAEYRFPPANDSLLPKIAEHVRDVPPHACLLRGFS